MTIVLVGEGDHDEFALLSEAIEDEGGDPVVWDTTDWPSDVPLAYDVGSETITVDQEIRIEDVTGVFPWPPHVFDLPQPRFADELETNGTKNLYLKLDQWRGIFNSFLPLFERHGATVFYPPRVQEYGGLKPLELEQLAQQALPVADTLVTTDEDRAREFIADHDEVVHRPVGERAVAVRSTGADQVETPLDGSANVPVLLQENVPGDDVRAFFLGDEVIGTGRYLTKERTGESADGSVDVEPIDLRDEVRRDVGHAARVSPFGFGAVTLRVTDRSHTFIDVDPWPRFALFDRNGATDVAGTLAGRLLS